jgi:hypothetical protein
MHALYLQESAFINNDSPWLCALPDVSESDATDAMVKTIQRICNRLIGMAERHFGPPGGHLEIDRNEVLREFNVERHHRDWTKEALEAFEPSAVWAWLENRYGGDSGAILANKQLAQRLRSHFGKSLGREVVMKAGFVVLTTSIWTDRGYLGVVELGYSTGQSLRNALRDLADLALHFGRARLAANLGEHANWRTANRRIISREKFGLGESGMEMIIITYQSQIEFRLHPDFAQQMQVFLATHPGA